MRHEQTLLCVPRGGLNDTLCQISLCRDYALNFKCNLAIDTSDSGLQCDFWDIFETLPGSRWPIVIRPTTEKLLIGSEFTVRPSFIEGGFSSLRNEVEYDAVLGKIVSKKTRLPIVFDLKVNHAEDLLVHCACGGGRASFRIIESITLNKKVSDHISKRLTFLPERYIGIHVRNTDLKSDYRSFFKRIKSQINDRNVFVCSDDANVVEFATSYFNKSRIYSLDKWYAPNGGPIHSLRSGVGIGYESSVEALTDLIGLGGAEKVLFAPTERQGSQVSKLDHRYYVKEIKRVMRFPYHNIDSGFAMLALFLFRNKSILRTFAGS